MNQAFSVNTGTLKLNAHSNEQRGLHNLAIGANAFFRNAVAHSTVFNVDFQTLTKKLAEAIQSNDWSNYAQNKRFYDSMTAETAIACLSHESGDDPGSGKWTH